MRITILDYKPYTGPSKKLKAKFVFSMDLLDRVDATASMPITIKSWDWKHWEDGPLKTWISPPDKSIKNQEGRYDKIFDYVVIETMKGEFQRECLKAIKAYLDEHPVDNGPKDALE